MSLRPRPASVPRLAGEAAEDVKTLRSLRSSNTYLKPNRRRTAGRPPIEMATVGPRYAFTLHVFPHLPSLNNHHEFTMKRRSCFFWIKFQLGKQLGMQRPRNHKSLPVTKSRTYSWLYARRNSKSSTTICSHTACLSVLLALTLCTDYLPQRYLSGNISFFFDQIPSC